MSWFSHHAVLFALLCAAAAVVYGLWLTSWLLGRPELTAIALDKRSGVRPDVPQPDLFLHLAPRHRARIQRIR